MGKRVLAAILICCASSAAMAADPQGSSPPVDTFPSAQEYYYPLLADPTELGFSGRYLWQVGGQRYSEVTLGDYMGLLRWKMPADWDMQLNVAGGVESRFNMSTTHDALEVTDFTFAVPIDMHRGPNTIRAGYWHTSSHLGDDYIHDNPGVLIEKRSDDLFRAIYSFTPTDWLRLYAGGSYAFNVINVGGRDIYQGGIELTGPYMGNHQAQLFLAQDFQTLQRVRWNPAYTIRAGVRATNDKHIAAAKLFVEYFTGHYYFLQLYEQKESRIGIGLALEIGNPEK